MRNIFLTSALFFTLLLNAQTLTLKSKELGEQATMKQVFNGFGCTGENQSPHLSWDNIPQDTKSFAVTIYDRNTPAGIYNQSNTGW